MGLAPPIISSSYYRGSRVKLAWRFNLVKSSNNGAYQDQRH